MNNASIVFLLSLLVVRTQFLEAQSSVDPAVKSAFVYDLQVLLPAPVAGHDSILNYFNALKISPALYDFLAKKDPSRAKLNPGIFSPFSLIVENDALTKPGLLSSLESGVLFAPLKGGNLPDYFIRGTVKPAPGGTTFLVDIELVAGGSTEIVSSGHGVLNSYPSGDPAAAAASAMAQMQPAYDKIMSFETNKRNSGQPYAIGPT
ncbi:MAG: hypothetical protein WCO84_07880, partial [bacterium]